jgi:hypothetical protein
MGGTLLARAQLSEALALSDVQDALRKYMVVVRRHRRLVEPEESAEDALHAARSTAIREVKLFVYK